MIKKRVGILALALCLILTGCGGGKEESSLKEEFVPPEGQAPAETQAPPTEKAPVYDDSLLGEISVRGDSLSDSGEVIFSFDYQVPQLLDDTEEARNFNSMMKTACTDAESGFSIPYQGVHWEHFWNGSLVSLVVEMRYPFVSLVSYFTYNYDFGLGKSLSNQEVLDRMGVTTEDADLALHRAAARITDKQIANALTYGEMPEAMVGLRCETLARGNLNPHSCPLYLDDSGNIHYFATIGIPAAGGYYSEDLTLDLGPGQGVEKTVTCDFITAELKNNAVTLTFENTGLAGLFLGADAVEFGVPYPVEGLYGDYTDMTLGFVGNGGYVYLALVDTDGHVSICSVSDCINCGEQFFTIAPLPRLQNVVSLQADQENGMMYAVTGSGESINLFEDLESACSLLPYPLQDSSWYSTDGTYSFTTSGDSPLTGYGAGGGMLASGLSLRYLGMTEAGMHYYCPMLDEEGNFIACLLSLEPLTPFSEFDSGYRITLTQMFGPEQSGLRDGPMVLTQVAG